VDSYTSLILDVLANTDYVGPLNQFCECFLEELVDCLPHISSYDFTVSYFCCFHSSPLLLH